MILLAIFSWKTVYTALKSPNNFVCQLSWWCKLVTLHSFQCWGRANIWNICFYINSVQWPIYIFNSVANTKLGVCIVLNSKTNKPSTKALHVVCFTSALRKMRELASAKPVAILPPSLDTHSKYVISVPPFQ